MSPDVESLRSEVDHLRRENAELRQRERTTVGEPVVGCQVRDLELALQTQPLSTLTNKSSVQEKVGLFRSLFRGREDVYAVSWVNERTGKKGYSPACEDPWSLRKGQVRKYLPLTDQVIHDHLSGDKTIGTFPLLKDNSCIYWPTFSSC